MNRRTTLGRRPAILAALILFGLCAASAGQVKNTEHTLKLEDGFEPSGKIEDVAFLQGYWVGKGLGGTCEEMWSAPMDGAMVGTFRLMSDEMNFSEFFVLSERDGSLALRLKHFDQELKGWEEKDKFVEFKFIKAEGRTAWFGGLTYELGDDGKLRVFVAMKKDDGTLDEGEFTFERR